MPSPGPAHVPAITPDTSSAVRLALEHYDPRPIRKVPIERWRDVFTRVGWPPGLADLAVATTEDVVAALTRGSLPSHLHDLLQVLHDMGTAKGGHVLNESAVELGLNRDDWPDAVEELAVEVWARARNDARYRRLLLFAEVALHERVAEASYREFFGSEVRRIEDPNAGAAALRAALAPWFQKEKMGGRVKILLQPEDDRVVFCVFHGKRRQYESTFDDDGSEGMVGFRPLVCDVVTYEHLDGRLRVTARSKRLVELYRQMLGAVFFGDGAFFSERPRYDLGPLAQAIETGSLPPPSESSDIHRVNLVDCIWTISDGIQHRIHGFDGRDCTRQARRAQFRAGEDKLTQVTLAFTFRTAGRIERTDIVLRTGNRFECRRPGRRDAIEDYLTRIGVRVTGSAASATPAPPRTLLGVRSAAQWRALFGDRLVDACDLKVLRSVTRSSVEPVGVVDAGGTDPVTLIELGTEELTLARSEGDGDVRLVRSDEMLGYELDARRLAELLRDELECGLSLRDLPFQGAYDLGPISVGSVTVCPFLITAPAAASPRTALPVLAAMAGVKAKWIVILPPDTPPDEWVIATPLRAPLPPFRVRADIIRTLGLDDQVTALERAGGVRLVVDTQRHAAWLDGVTLNLSETQRRLLEELARATARGQPLPAGDLAQTLCGDRENKDLVRQRVRELSKSVHERMRAEGRSSPESKKLVKSFRKGEGYRLVLDPYVE